jgi:hypothetical protein
MSIFLIFLQCLVIQHATEVVTDLSDQQINAASAWDNDPPDVLVGYLDHAIVDWYLYDDTGGGGYFRVLEDSFSYSEFPDWTAWTTNGTEVHIDLMSTMIGSYNMTLLYNDTAGNWYHDDVNVTIYDAEPPWDDDPGDESFLYNSGLKNLHWVLSDEQPYFDGSYQILYQGSPVGPWETWFVYSWEVTVQIDTNRTVGDYNYTIQYTDWCGHWNYDDIIVTIYDNVTPTDNDPPDTQVLQNATSSITWILCDNYKTGQFRVLRNSTPYGSWGTWTMWDNNTSIIVPIDTSTLGLYNYTIEFLDNESNPSADVVFINVYNPTSPGGIPGFEWLLTISGLAAILFYHTQRKKEIDIL